MNLMQLASLPLLVEEPSSCGREVESPCCLLVDPGVGCWLSSLVVVGCRRHAAADRCCPADAN